jgi:hypothetical protein
MSHAAIKSGLKIGLPPALGRNHGASFGLAQGLEAGIRSSNRSRSGNAPTRPKRSLPPPPPPAALQRPAARVATRLAAPAQVPEYFPTLEVDAMQSPLFGSSLAKSSQPGAAWQRILSYSLGAGLLVASGYMGVLVKQELGARHVPRLIALQSPVTQPSAAKTSILPTRPVASAAPVVDPSTGASAPITKLAKATNVFASADVATHHAGFATIGKSTTLAAAEQRTARSHTASKPTALHATAIADDADEDDATEQDESSVSPATRAAAKPAQPSRAAVQQAIEQIRPQLTACAAGLHGSNFADITVQASGHVVYSVIEGAFAGTAQGSCMARALRTASFPSFSGSAFKVRYPFVF